VTWAYKTMNSCSGSWGSARPGAGPLLPSPPMSLPSATTTVLPGQGHAGRARTLAAVAGGGWVGVAGWMAVAGGALVVGSLTVRSWPDAGLRAAPLYGWWDWQLGPAFAPAAVLGVLVVALGPALSASVPWRRLVPLAGAATVAWSVALAATDGWSRVAAPLGNRHDYLPVVDGITGPGHFLRTYTDRLAGYPIHLKGHPPGMPLLLWTLDRVGLGGTGWAAAVVLTGAGLATAATLVALRAVAGEVLARRAAPFVAIAPAALWLGTSADALFAGVGILGCACLAAGRRPTAHVLGGLLLGAALHLSYGAVVLLVIPAAVAAWRRDLRPLGWAAGGVAAVAAAFALSGFWWFDGLDATRHFYEIGVAADRPYPVFTAVVNPGVVALATGPATAAGLWCLARRLGSAARSPASDRDRREGSSTDLPAAAAPHRRDRAAVAVLPVAGLVMVLVANLSGMSKGEVERIWLPFYPWLLTATAALPRRNVRPWLAAQVALAVGLEMSLRSAW
jgi:hypothetical protein